MTKRRTVTIRNVDEDVLALLSEIREKERRQLAAILEDCVHAYWAAYYDAEE
ncbi:hypothetical protein [Halocynthiibacter styelae]|uniref:Ribbon-helix-helix protein, CopG family n=1 Tax=Halocynthiibacter styelae TaxID=2761955 RepID=A0A8J7LJ49_9RHOB|nr:hypothetical protein [Paenihalocynthiibacter styelae]MBI1492035.1 hypothetical protein [Paenihalocynthiibacter styelae]